MLLGYARVSTQDQDTAAQIGALTSVGCELIFQEKVTGGRWDRPELHRLLSQLRTGDVLVVWGSKPNPSKFPANLDSMRHSRARR